MSAGNTTTASGNHIDVQGRPDAHSGKEFGVALLKRYEELHAEECAADPDKWRLFSEIILHNAFDMAGNRYVKADDGTRFSAFDAVFEGLAKVGSPSEGISTPVTGETALSLVLKHLPSYTKGYVQTPHPTEVLSSDAIDAEQALHMELEHNQALFNGGPHLNNEAALNKVLGKMQALFEKIKPVTESMDIDEEMRRSVAFSEQMFDSVPITAQAVIDSAARHGAFEQTGTAENPRRLSDDHLTAFNFLIQPQTWSPGDRDSKTLMTCAKLEKGVGINRRAMQLHYMNKLANIISSLPEEKTGNLGEIDTKGQLREVLWRVMQDISINSVTYHLDRDGKKAADDHDKLNAEARAEIEKLQEVRGVIANLSSDVNNSHSKPMADVEAKVSKEKLAEALSAFESRKQLENANYKIGVDYTESRYLTSLDFISDIEALRSTPDGVNPPQFKAQTLPDGNKCNFTELDALYMQANNFGKGALRVQIRENSKMHSEVMAMALEEITKAGITIPGYDPQLWKTDAETLGDEEKKELNTKKRVVLDSLTDMLMKPEMVENPKTHKMEAHASEVAQKITKCLSDKITQISPAIKAAEEKKKDAPNYTENERKFYETLKGCEIATKNPEAIPNYLIAECHGGNDMLEAFFLLKAMEPEATRYRSQDESGHIIPKVELVPLFEYRPDVEKIPEYISDAYKNPYFAEHHNGMVDPHHPAITLADSEAERFTTLAKQLGLTITTLQRTLGLSEEESRQFFTGQRRPTDEQIDKLAERFGVSSEFLKTELPRTPEIETSDTLGLGGKLSANITPKDQNYNHLTVRQVATMFNITGLDEKALKDEDGNDKIIKGLKTVMMAGSDITKSSGCGGAGLVLHATNDVRKRLLEQDPPILLLDYTGCGSGVHRSHPVGTEYETTQGRGMRQSDSNIAQKTLMNVGRYIMKKLGLQETTAQQYIDGDDPREKLLGAQLNLGNLEALKLVEGLWKAQTQKRLEAQMDAYKSIYTDPAYSAYMGFTADKAVKLTSYAARAAARIGAFVDKDTPPLVDVGNLRAIGYGAALNAAGSCTPYFYGTGDFLAVDSNNKIPEGDIKDLVQLYLKDPITQDTINRATYGVVMANMNTAWKYLDCTRTIEGKDENGKDIVKITDKDGKTVDLNSLMAETPEVEAAKVRLSAYLEKVKALEAYMTEHSLSDSKKAPDELQIPKEMKLTVEEKHTLAVQQLSKIDNEYMRAKQGLLQLQKAARASIHEELTAAKKPAGGMEPIDEAVALKLTDDVRKLDGNNAMDTDQRLLLAELPKTLREQIVESRKNVDPAREKLATLFSEDLNGTRAMPTRFVMDPADPKKPKLDDEGKEIPHPDFHEVYNPMGAVFETFEHVPRAYSRVRWSIAHEKEVAYGDIPAGCVSVSEANQRVSDYLDQMKSAYGLNNQADILKTGVAKAITGESSSGLPVNYVPTAEATQRTTAFLDQMKSAYGLNHQAELLKSGLTKAISGEQAQLKVG